MSKQSDANVKARLLWGFRWGLYYGVAFSVQAVVVSALTHRLSEIRGVPLWLLLAGYIVFGSVAGIIVGFLRPQIVSGFAAATVAFVAVYPFAFFLFATFDRQSSVRAWLIGAAVITAIWATLGGPIARHYLSDRKGDSSKP